MRRRAAAALAVLACLLGAPAGASAARDVELGIADDAQLLHEPDARRALDTALRWKAQGIDRVRLLAEWYKVVPGVLDPVRPASFDPADPGDPQYGWAKLDRALGILRLAGLKPLLVVTGPAPVWATEEPGRRNPRWRPDPHQFGVFAGVVARRYGAQVDRYVIWNEPNQPLWLQPQSTCAGRRCTPYAPFAYRRLVRAAQPAIERADPGAEVLFGALAPRGRKPTSRNHQLPPLLFLRWLGCVSTRYARVRSGPCQGFAPLTADGFAYHPHSVRLAPDVPSGEQDDANLADLPLLTQVLDRIQARGGLRRAGGGRFPLHLTEWGYQTNPPDTKDGVATADQDRWLQHGAYLAWRAPRVRSLVHYLWRDEAVRTSAKTGSTNAGWQSGLLTADGRAKRALAHFAVPFWADVRRDGTALLWGQVRPRDAARVSVQVRRDGVWRRIAFVVPDRHGTWTLRRRLGTRAEDLRFVAGARRSGVLRVRRAAAATTPSPAAPRRAAPRAAAR